MAWENCEIANLNNCVYGNSLLSAITNYNQTQRIYAFSTNMPNMTYNNLFDVRNYSDNELIYSDDEITLTIKKTGSGLVTFGFNLTIDGTTISTSSAVDTRNGKYGTASYGFVIDEANQYAQFVVAHQYHESSVYYTVDTSNMLNKSTKLYEYIIAHPLITYQWSSVPAISGKMGAISLATVDDVSGGNIVTDATSSDVNLTSGANLFKMLSHCEVGGG